jgi:hypothetical protein
LKDSTIFIEGILLLEMKSSSPFGVVSVFFCCWALRNLCSFFRSRITYKVRSPMNEYQKKSQLALWIVQR